MNEGKKLLSYFRDEQGKKGRYGCRCSDCEEDMQKAFDKFMEEIKSTGFTFISSYKTKVTPFDFHESVLSYFRECENNELWFMKGFIEGELNNRKEKIKERESE